MCVKHLWKPVSWIRKELLPLNSKKNNNDKCEKIVYQRSDTNAK